MATSGVVIAANYTIHVPPLVILAPLRPTKLIIQNATSSVSVRLYKVERENAKTLSAVIGL